MLYEKSCKTKIDPIDLYVGKRLKSRRIMLGLSQQDLGDAVKVSVQQIQKYEKGANRVSSSRLYYFAQLMKVPLNYFFEKLNCNSVESSSAFAEDQEQFVFTDNDAASERELVTLVRAFNDINDIKVRKGLLDFVRSLASERAN